MARTLAQIEKDLNALKCEIEVLKNKQKVKIGENLKIGDTFEIAGLQWKILDITDKGYHCLAERFEDGMQFDNNVNDWRSSALRKYLNGEFLEMLATEIGKENIVPFERNLLSLDGQTEYETCEDEVSLLTFDEYRKYRSLIPNADYWWWLITPWSTPCNDYKTWVTVVSPSGRFDYNDCLIGGGVRPFCIFSPSIFESEEA